MSTTTLSGHVLPGQQLAVKRLAVAIAQILFGLLFFVFGLNGFLQFLPMPPPPSDAAGAFAGALFQTGYIFPVIKGIEVLAGVALIFNRFVPLALTLLAPIIVNIALFHFVLAGTGFAMTVVILALEIFLAWSRRDAFRPMLAIR